MTRYHTSGFRAVRAESMREAAEMFANRAARQAYGRRGYARTCTEGARSQDYTLAEYSAFIGCKTGPNETTGHNVQFTVQRIP